MPRIIESATSFKIELYFLLLMSLSLSGCVSNNIKGNNIYNSKSEPAHSLSISRDVKGESTSTSGTERAWETTPQIKSTAFSGINTAWLLTSKDDELLLTEDGGESWNKMSPDVYDKSNQVNFSQISFIDSQRGWAVNVYGQIWRTSDGGRDWTAIAKLKWDNPEWCRVTSLEQIKFTDDLHGWIIETYTVWRTEDGGTNWNVVFFTSDPHVKGQPVRGFFLDGVKAWICGTEGEVYRTVDGGKNWHIQSLGEAMCSDIFFVDENTGWLSIRDGQLYRTDDGGQTWQLQPELDQKKYIDSIWFLNKNEGWGAGRELLKGSTKHMPLPQGIVVHTLDGGRTWQSVNIGSTEPFFHRIYFADAKHGWLFARDNTYRTDDGGESWHLVFKLPSIKDSNGVSE